MNQQLSKKLLNQEEFKALSQYEEVPFCIGFRLNKSYGLFTIGTTEWRGEDYGDRARGFSII